MSEEGLGNMEVVLVGPAGILGAMKTITRVFKLQGSQLGLPRVPENPTTVAGIESLFIIPPQTLEPDKLTERLSELFPDLTNRHDALATVEYKRDDRYWELLTDEEKIRVSELDYDIAQSLKQDDKKRLEELLKERAKLLNTAGSKAYDALDPQKQENWEPAKIAAISYFGLLRLFREFFLKGVKKDLTKLEDKGLKVSWIIPEYDMFVVLRDIQRMYKLPLDQLLQKVSVIGLERATHAGWATLPKQLADAISRIISP